MIIIITIIKHITVHTPTDRPEHASRESNLIGDNKKNMIKK